MRGMVRRLRDGAPHQRRRAQHAVEPRVHDHLQDRPHPSSLVAHQPRDRAVERDLGRRVRAVAELVLQPLDPEPGLWPLEQEAREPGRRLREHEERVAHRCGAEPFVPVQQPHIAVLSRHGLVCAHVRTALPLRHRHPAERVAARQPRSPLGGQVRLRAQCGHRCERHRERAADAGLDLAEQHEERGARDVRSGLPLDPRQGLHVRLEADPEERVPRRVELDLVDPLAVPVMRSQPGRVLVGKPAPVERVASEQFAERGDPLLPGLATLAAESLDERRVLLVEVVAGERRRLVRAARARDGHQAGGTFWLKRSTLAGSYRRLTACSRSNASAPKAARTRSTGSSPCM